MTPLSLIFFSVPLGSSAAAATDAKQTSRARTKRRSCIAASRAKRLPLSRERRCARSGVRRPRRLDDVRARPQDGERHAPVRRAPTGAGVRRDGTPLAEPDGLETLGGNALCL